MSHDVENKRPINDNNVVDTPTSTLLSQFIAARGAITQLNTVVNALLDGQGGIGRKATQLAYTFTISCIENPQEASNIPGWNDAGVQKGWVPLVAKGRLKSPKPAACESCQISGSQSLRPSFASRISHIALDRPQRTRWHRWLNARHRGPRRPRAYRLQYRV